MTKKEKSKGRKILKKEAKEKKKKAILSKIAGILLILIGIIVIGYISVFLFIKIFSAPRLAKILPEENTIVFMEADLSSFNGQYQRLQELTENYPAYSKDKFVNYLFTEFKIDFYKDVYPWMGGHVGFSLLKNSRRENVIHEVFFIETRDEEKTLNFLKKYQMTNPDDQIVADDYKDYKIYTYKISNDLTFSFAKKYLILSNSTEALKDIIDVIQGEQKSVRQNKNYSTIVSNTSRNYLAFMYLDIQKGLKNLLRNPKYVRMFGGELTYYMPLLKIYEHVGFSVNTQEEGLKMQSYTTINKDELKKGIYFRQNEKYKGNLLQLVPDNALSVFGGHNLSAQIKRFEELLTETNAAARIIFEGELNKIIKKYFSDQITMEKNIYPLFEKEYLLFMTKSFSEPEYNFIIEIKDRDNFAEMLPHLNEAFSKLTAKRNPVKKSIVLEDGTEAEEVVIDFGSINKESEIFEDSKLVTFKTPDGNAQINYTVKDGLFIFSTNISDLKNIVKKLKDKNTTLYKELTQRILNSADEIGMIDLEAFWPSTKFLEPWVIELLVPYNKVTYGNETFDNGTVSEFYFQIKQDVEN